MPGFDKYKMRTMNNKCRTHSDAILHPESAFLGVVYTELFM